MSPHQDHHQFHQLIAAASQTFSSRCRRSLSAQPVDFVRKALQPNPSTKVSHNERREDLSIVVLTSSLCEIFVSSTSLMISAFLGSL